MIPTIYSIGYAVKEDREYLEELMKQPDIVLIDIRKEPSSQMAGFDERHRHELSQKYGKKYRWLGNMLGNLNYRPKDRTKGFRLVNEEAGISKLIQGLKYGHSIVLLCGCSKAHTCHRTYIARKLIAKLLNGDTAFDVSKSVIKSLLNDKVRDVFMSLAKEEQFALDRGELLDAEGYRLQALELLTLDVPDLWTEEAVDFLKQKGTQAALAH
jgi:hypothetical protein